MRPAGGSTTTPQAAALGYGPVGFVLPIEPRSIQCGSSLHGRPSHGRDVITVTSQPAPRPGSEVVARKRWRPSRKLIVSVVLGALAIAFVLQNTGRGRVDLFFWHVTMQAWIWLLSIFILGVVVGSVFPWLRRSKRKPAKGNSAG